MWPPAVNLPSHVGLVSHTLFPGPLSLLIPLPGRLFPQLSKWLHSSIHSTVTSQCRPYLRVYPPTQHSILYLLCNLFFFLGLMLLLLNVLRFAISWFSLFSFVLQGTQLFKYQNLSCSSGRFSWNTPLITLFSVFLFLELICTLHFPDWSSLIILIFYQLVHFFSYFLEGSNFIF